MPNENAPGLNIAYPQQTNPLEEVGRVIQLRDMMAQQQLRQQQLRQSAATTANIEAQEQQRQRDLQSEQSFTDLIKKNNGNYTAALDQLSKSGQASGSFLLQKGQAINAAMEQHLKKDAEQRAADKDVLSKADAGFTGLSALPEDSRQQQYNNLLSSWSKDPAMSPILHKYMDAGVIPAQYNEDALKALHLHVQGALNIANEAEKKEQALSAAASRAHLSAETAKLEAETPGVKAKSDMEVAKTAGLKSMTPDDWAANVDAVIDPSKEPDLNSRTKHMVSQALKMGDYGKAEAVIKDASDQIGRTETAVRSAKATEPIKISIAAATSNARENAKEATKKNSEVLTDEDYKLEGQKYALTGKLPDNMGMGGADTKKRIIHEGDQFARNSGMNAHDMVAAKAAFAGDVRSLSTLKNTYGTMRVAEQTAGGNLDQFLETMKKVADTGSPLLNKPLRAIQEHGLGSNEMAAMQAARQVATVEVGKVLSQMTGSGSGVLSDSQRKEVDTLLNKDSTLGQIYSAAKIIRADMKRRSDSYQSVINNVQENMGRPKDVTVTPTPAANRPKLEDIFKKK